MDPNNPTNFNAFYAPAYHPQSNPQNSIPNYQNNPNPNFQNPINPSQMYPNYPNYQNVPSPHPNYSQMPFVTFANYRSANPEPELLSVPETQELPDSIPETQPSSSKRKHKKKEVETKITKTNTKWTTEEEVALAESFIDASENPILGNDQTGTMFWNEVREKFFKKMGKGEYRSKDMISGKWRDLQKKVAKFNGIYTQRSNNRKSGESDEDVYKEALEEYRILKGVFAHGKAWDVMKESTKWYPVPKLKTSKRSKTSSSNDFVNSPAESTGRCHIDLNESDDDLEITMPQEPQRPPGRNKSKKAQSSSSSSSVYKEALDDISGSIKKLVQIQEDKQYNLDMKMLMTPHDHLTGLERQIAEKTKQRIMKKYDME